jgi:hypothetical protein
MVAASHDVYECARGDTQCDTLNKMIRARPVIFMYESFFNNVLVHYAVGFAILYFLVRVGWRALFAKRTLLLASLLLMTGAVLGWLATDAMSYALHLFIDSPHYRRLVSKQERHNARPVVVGQHHEFPLNYSYMSSTELVAVAYPVFLPALAVCSLLHVGLLRGLLSSPAYVGFFTSMTVFSLVGSYAHRWAHERNHGLLKDPIVRALQDAGVLLHPKAHSVHHEAEDDDARTHYSLVSGAAQVALDPVLAHCRSANLCSF